MNPLIKKTGVSLLLLLSGCLHVPEQTVLAPPRQQVKCSGDCLEWNAKDGTDRAALMREFDDHHRHKRLASARILVEQHLDDAIEILRARPLQRTATESERALARIVDQLLRHPPNDGWLTHLQKTTNATGLGRAEQTLAKAKDAFREEQWSQVGRLVQDQLSMLAFPYQAIQASLLRAEAQRRQGQTRQAGQTWQQTASLAARHGSFFPRLLEQTAAQRPVSTDWPADAATALAAKLPAALSNVANDRAFPTEVLVWHAIGAARMERGQAAAALTAFKRADSHGKLPAWDDFQALNQARALFALEQTPAATSLLTVLASRPAESPWRAPAFALLGAGKLHDGHAQQAIAFLQNALKDSDVDFFGRADAEANLGLCFLMMGDETNGLRCLHSAQQRFAAQRNAKGLLHCLENEASYLQHANRAEDANRVRQAIARHDLQ